MNKKIVYKHSKDAGDFSYEEEGALVELGNDEFSHLKEKLDSSSKSYILKNSTGEEYQAQDIEDVARILSEKNITEVIVEEVSVDNAKLSRFKMNNSHFEKKLKLSPNQGVDLDSFSTNKSFALACEEILNQKDETQALQIIKSSPSSFTDETEDTNSVFTSTKKLVRRSSSIYKNFFRIKNNSEVFKLGKSFLDDYTDGKRCFGFSSNGSVSMMVNTLYGVGSFFNFYCHTRALIFCTPKELIGLKELISFEENKVFDPLLEKEYTIWESEGITVMTYDNLGQESLSKAYDFIDKLTRLSGVVFCTAPGNAALLKEIELYFQVFQRVDNFSCIVKKEKSKLKEIKKTFSFLSNYKVKLKGVIVGS
jgi:hypothetical protein